MAGTVLRMRSIRARRRARTRMRAWRAYQTQTPREASVVVIAHYVEADGDFETEISSLRAPSRRTLLAPRWSGAQLGSADRGRSERMRRIGFVCALLALALLGATGGGSALLAALGGAPTVAGAPLPQTLAQITGIGCLRDEAWSPDSRFFAYAGSTSQDCGYGQYAPNAINIYRAQDATLVRQLRPDAAIFAALGQSVPSSAAPDATPTPGAASLSYDSLLYAPDGSRFAIVFGLSHGTRTTLGVAVIRASDGRVERVVLGDALPGAVSVTSYAVWDLDAGTATAYPDPISDHPVGTLLAATAFDWTLDGRLVSTASAPTPALAPSGVIGDPSGDANFSAWQPGTLQLGLTNVPDTHGQALVYVYDAQIAAWSPDGRYVAGFFAAGGRVQPKGGLTPDNQALHLLGVAGIALLPLRDAGLDQVLRHVRTPMDADAQSDSSFGWIAYRPDGRAVALLDDQQDVTIFSTSTGAVLRTFTHLSLLLNPHNETAGVMRWSPDGTMLLLPDGTLLRVGRLGE